MDRCPRCASANKRDPLPHWLRIPLLLVLLPLLAVTVVVGCLEGGMS